jgi:hypothetical protein
MQTNIFTSEQEALISSLSKNQKDYHDNKIAFQTFRHFYNDNVAITLAHTYVISGKPALNADAMAGIVLGYRDKSGSKVCGYIRVIELNDNVCTLGTKRRDQLDFDIPEHTWTFTIEDAKARGLLNNRAWKTMSKNMLHKRCLTALLRAFYSDIIGQTYSPDELAEMNDKMSDAEKDRIIFQSVEGERVPSNPPQAMPPQRAPSQPIRPAVGLPYFTSVLATVNDIDLTTLSEDKQVALAVEMNDLLFDTVYADNTPAHLEIAKERLSCEPFYNTCLATKGVTNQQALADIHEYLEVGDPTSWDMFDKIQAHLSFN